MFPRPCTGRSIVLAVTTTVLLAALALVPVDVAAGPAKHGPAQEQGRPRGQEQEQESGQEPPERIEETVTVTATRLPVDLTDVPAAVELIDGEELRARPALGLDEALGWLPEASLFRRTPARAGHPTTQGLNLRGLAPSGTSRALVLVDGVPLTDAFGGWVYWDRVPMLAVERVEVALGGGSAPFGNQALGGVVQIVTRGPRPDGFHLRLRGGAGNDATRRIGLAASGEIGAVGTLLTAQAFDTDGYLAVAARDRGDVDRPVASRHLAGRLRLQLGAATSAVVEGLLEDRDNGTVLQTNETRAAGGSLHHDGRLGGGRWQATLFGRRQVFESRFSAVSDSRDSELLVLSQRVPSTDLGGSLLAVLEPAPLTALSLGADARRVDGHSEEHVVLAGFRRRPGGRQLLGGAFATAEATPGDWRLSLSLRADAWSNDPDQEAEQERSDAFLSPRVGLLWRPDDAWSLRASAYRSFRAPTLNELYRQFRVGDVLTRANPDLREERLSGIDAGVDWRGEIGSDTGLRLALTGYANELDGAVVNATVDDTGELLLRQRRNVGSARVLGLEMDARLTSGSWHLQGAMSWIDARFADDPSLPPDVVDNRLPQAPRHRATVSVGYHADDWQALAAVHATGEQFEDDLNELALAPGATLDMAADWSVAPAVRLGLRVQNLLDERLQVGRVPILTLGPPRSVVALLDVRLDDR